MKRLLLIIAIFFIYQNSWSNALWRSGAENNSTTAGVEFSAVTGTIAISTTTIRSGTYSLRCNPSSATGYITHYFASTNQSDGFFAKTMVRIATPSTATATQIIMFANVSNANKISIRLQTDSTLILYNEEDAAQVGSASAKLSLNAWHRIELKCDATTLASTSVEGLLNGTSFASGTVNLATGVGRLVLGIFTSMTGDIFFDDMGINNDNGTEQTTWLGDGYVVHLLPNATTSDSAWLSSGSGSNYEFVDEVTPNDATDFNKSKIASPLLDMYDLQNFTTVVGTDYNITLVMGSYRFRVKSTNLGSDAFTPEIKLKGGTTELGTEILPVSTTWRTNDPSANLVLNPKLVLYDLPGASTDEWTVQALDTTQLGMDVITTGETDTANVSTVWPLVEYVPQPASPINQGPEGTADRLFSSGWEDYAKSTSWGEWILSTNGTFVTSPKRAGSRSGKVATASATGGFMAVIYSSGVGTDTMAARVYFYLTHTPPAEHTLLVFGGSTTSFGSPKMSMRIKTDRTLLMYNEEDIVRLDSSTTVLDTLAWYAVELLINTQTLASTEAQFRFWKDPNGAKTTSATKTGINLASAPVSLYAGWNQTISDTVYFEDLAFQTANGVGSYSATYPDSGRLTMMVVDGNSTPMKWVVVGATSQYLAIDEDTANGVTDYIRDSATTNDLNDTAWFSLSDISEISTNDTVKLVHVGFVAARSATTPDYFKLIVRDGSSGTASDKSDSMQLSSATYFFNRLTNANPATFKLTHYYVNGAGGSGMKGSDVNNIQIGVMVAREVDADTPRITQLYTLIEWNGQGAGGAKRSRLPVIEQLMD